MSLARGFAVFVPCLLALYLTCSSVLTSVLCEQKAATLRTNNHVRMPLACVLAGHEGMQHWLSQDCWMGDAHVSCSSWAVVL